MPVNEPRALDLFCGAGGATKGLQRAGFHVTGVDIKPQPRYCGDVFIQADAMEYPLGGFDFIWASPPCQAYSATQNAVNNREAHPDLVDPVRQRLRRADAVWCIENVQGAPLFYTLKLCGSSFHQDSWRHRIFESSFLIIGPTCRHDLYPTPLNPYNSISRRNKGITGTDAIWRRELQLDWMNGNEASLAIPPAYSEFIGKQAMKFLETLSGIPE